MINKQEVLELLEKEREKAVEWHLPQMALGFVQAIKVIKDMEENQND